MQTPGVCSNRTQMWICGYLFGVVQGRILRRVSSWSHKHDRVSLQSLDQEIAAPASLTSASEEANFSIGFPDLDGTFTLGLMWKCHTLGVDPLRDVCCASDFCNSRIESLL